ncbi:MAG: hypothetical protein OJF60_002190 [Burkholderiaceae bacterium]|jgi:hypothetical protein|nr:MAG: hypothetical protein OJF60_002190 [Burkholderiaceae bacterium]
MKTSRVALGAMLALASACHAQTMYRCGNTFSQQPCSADAQPLAVPTPAAGAATLAPTPPKPDKVKPTPVAEPSVPAANPLPAPVPQPVAKSQLVADADQCMEWYRPRLRDPRGAYYDSPSRDNRVLSIRIHATNGYGGYVTEDAACEIYNGQLDDDWTKIHAKRRGW